jgi:DNA (cytosine-5)-methyltransferase 1
MEEIKKITGIWNLKTAYMPKNKGKVFSCFSCCGGSTMGYKLAGYDVIGCNEIDPKVFQIYKANHNPKHAFVMSIRDLLLKEELPEEMFDLDILDGSPPCTSFSTAGVRERDWGKEKTFSEGQALQRLDDLFFEFIALGKRLQPKIIIAENVAGIIKGKAKGYVKEIVKAYSDAGYNTQLFRLNGANMGLPQARDRVFFVSSRKDLNYPKLKLSFSEKVITIREVLEIAKTLNEKDPHQPLSKSYLFYWRKCKQGEKLREHHPKRHFFSKTRLSLNKPSPTLTTNFTDVMHPTEERSLSTNEWKILSSFPMDMDWEGWGQNKKKWGMGMSVPPFMMQRIAIEISKQWIENG